MQVEKKICCLCYKSRIVWFASSIAVAIGFVYLFFFPAQGSNCVYNHFSAEVINQNNFPNSFFADNNLLVQPFCTTAQFGNSRVKPIIVDKLAGMK